MPKQTALIDFYFDVISPYSFVVYEALTRYERVWPITYRMHPVYLGGIFKNTGNISPVRPELAIRMPLQQKDYARNGHYWQIPLGGFKEPYQRLFKETTLLPQRFITAVETKHPELVPKLARAYWCRFWGKDEPIYRPEDTREVASEVGVPDVERFIEMAGTAEVKDKLVKRTTQATDLGAFGVPWLVVRKTPQAEPECFFGSDRFHHIAQYLGVNFYGPLNELSIYDKHWVKQRTTLCKL